jgi:NitT/TauT family transport system ATP-binding protein
MENNHAILVKDASKTFDSDRGPVEALQNFDLFVEEGEFVSIVGPSGCGKSTLMWAIAALWPLSSGSIKVYGEEIVEPRQDVGLVFQQSNLLPWRNLKQNINFPFEIMKIDIAPHQERIDELLELTGLTGFENHAPRELSGGMQQRASIVRALAYDPRILLMDEPFGALDAFTRDEMNLMLLGIWERSRKTILFITHRIAEAVYLSDRVYVMTPRPGRNSTVVDIDLPRPRPLSLTTTREFFELTAQIKEKIYADVAAATAAGEYSHDAYAH